MAEMTIEQMRNRERDMIRRLGPNFAAITGRALDTVPALAGSDMPNMQRVDAMPTPAINAAIAANPFGPRPFRLNADAMPGLTPAPAVPQGGMGADPMRGRLQIGSAVADSAPVTPQMMPRLGGNPMPAQGGSPASAAAASQPVAPVVREGPLNVPPGARNVVPSGANVMDMPNLSDTYGGAPPGMSFMAAPDRTAAQSLADARNNFTNQLMALGTGTGAPGEENSTLLVPGMGAARRAQLIEAEALKDREREGSRTALEVARIQADAQRLRERQLSPENEIELVEAEASRLQTINPNLPRDQARQQARTNIAGLRPQGPQGAGAPGQPAAPGQPRGNRTINQMLSEVTADTPQAALARIYENNPQAGAMIGQQWPQIEQYLRQRFGEAAMNTALRGTASEGLRNPLFVGPGQTASLEQQVLSAMRNRAGGPQYGATPGQNPFAVINNINPLNPSNAMIRAVMGSFGS